MKHFLTIICVGLSICIHSQDIIIKRDGTEIFALVQEIGETEVKYKKFENQGGPTYSVSVSNIFMIKFENGTKEVFGTQSAQDKPQNNTQPSVAPVAFNPSDHTHIQAVKAFANSAAQSLTKCCSKWGGSNSRFEIEWEKVQYSGYTKEWIIPMKAIWNGSVSGNEYWIKGTLTVMSNGNRLWEKTADSGGFQPGCGQGCIN